MYLRSESRGADRQVESDARDESAGDDSVASAIVNRFGCETSGQFRSGLLAEGKFAKEVARVLNITPCTVEFHKYTMMQKLNIKTNAEQIYFAIKRIIVSI